MDIGLFDKNGTPINVGDKTRLVLNNGEVREFDVCFKTVNRTTVKTLPGFEPQTLLRRLFGRLDNPVIRCTNCLCSYCANNAEEVYRRVKPEEMAFPCLDCDDCREYGGGSGENRCKEDCAGFTVSAYGAGRIRRGFKVVEGGKKDVF